jgi:hypothetical protein
MRYKIHDQTEETYCDWCGRPLLVGDVAYQGDPDYTVFCCEQDQRAWKAEERREAAGLTGKSIYATVPEGYRADPEEMRDEDRRPYPWV